MTPTCQELGPGVSPEQLLNTLAVVGEPDGLSCLWGDWFGGGAIFAHSPLLRIDSVRIDHDQDLARLDDHFELSGDRPDGVIGGGWIGCIGYSPSATRFGFYDSLLRYRDSEWFFESLGLPGREAATDNAMSYWRDLIRPSTSSGGPSTGSGSGVFRTRGAVGDVKAHYLASIDDAIGRIHHGDFYQANICTRLYATFEGSSAALFARGAAALKPSYGAYLGADSDSSGTVISFSPELFLRVVSERVSTAPIKGTAPRRPGETESAVLRASTKDQAENIMIVDLMRNDLSRVCATGTVIVDDLLALEPHPGIWHLVSKISGTLRPEVSTSDLLAATFPAGSITGAPKSAARAAIDELEPQARGAYTGAIGMISPLAGTEVSVAIRTFETSAAETSPLEGGRSTIELGVGGGITVDSVPALEWQECLHKARPLIVALGSRLEADLEAQPAAATAAQLAGGVFESILSIDGRVQALAGHLARLDRSCRELYGIGVEDDLADRVRAAVGAGRVALRVHAIPPDPASKKLRWEIDARPWLQRPTPGRARSVPQPAGLWRHKWWDRDALVAAEREADGDFALLVSTEDDVVLETTRGNIFAQRTDGVWLTPPLRDDLLPGITRREILDLAPELGIRMEVRPFTLADLAETTAAFWTSSLSLAVPITGIDHHTFPEVREGLVARLTDALAH